MRMHYHYYFMHYTDWNDSLETFPPFLGSNSFFVLVWQNSKWFYWKKISSDLYNAWPDTLAQIGWCSVTIKREPIREHRFRHPQRTCKCTAKVSVCTSRNVILGCSLPLMNNLVFFLATQTFAEKILEQSDISLSFSVFTLSYFTRGSLHPNWTLILWLVVRLSCPRHKVNSTNL